MMSAVPQVNYYQGGDDDDDYNDQYDCNDQHNDYCDNYDDSNEQHLSQHGQEHGQYGHHGHGHGHGGCSPMQQRCIKTGGHGHGHVIGTAGSPHKKSLGAELDRFLHHGNGNGHGHDGSQGTYPPNYGNAPSQSYSGPPSHCHSNGSSYGPHGPGGGLQRSCSGSVASNSGYSCSQVSQMSLGQMSQMSASTQSSIQSMISGCSQSVAPSLISNAPLPPPPVVLADYELSDLARKAQKSCQRKFANSLNSDAAYAKLAHMAQFDYDYEIQIGTILGQGQFGIVSEVKSIVMRRQSSELMFHKEQVRERELVASRTIRREGSRNEGDCRYAVKVLRKQQCCDKLQFYNAYRDMAIEIHLLAALDHRHILKLRGISSAQNTKTSQGECAPSSLFLLTDKLYGTLKDKYNDWRAMHKKLTKRLSGFKKIVGGSKAAAELKERKRHLLEARLRVLRDISSAIQYLHQHNIIQRDLKPDNVGFDVRGDVKIFDFGLSTEIPPQQDAVYKSDRNDVCLYQLTGMTGSLRYMAPENYNHEPYNESIDIYALSIIVWQTMTLQHLYPNHDKQMIIELVVQRGNRPDLQPTGGEKSGSGALALTESMQKLLKNMWSVNVGNRPPAKYVLTKLQRELALVKEAKSLIQVQEQQESLGSRENYEEAGGEDSSSVVARELHTRRRAAEAARQRIREQGPSALGQLDEQDMPPPQVSSSSRRSTAAKPVDCDMMMLKKHQAQRQLRQSRRDDLLSNIDKALDLGGNSGGGNSQNGESREVQRMKEKYQKKDKDRHSDRHSSKTMSSSRRTVSTLSTNSNSYYEGDDHGSDASPPFRPAA